MERATDRRRFITTVGGLGALAGISGVAGLTAMGHGSSSSGPTADTATVPSDPPIDAIGRVPWPYQPLDPSAVAQQSFAVYQKGFCMLGTFEPLVRPVAERLGPPYTAFPFAMFTYGAGGVAGWGTLCGTLNGAAAAFALLSPQPGPLTAALFEWYEREAIPDFVPSGARFPNLPVAGGSVLCHLSVTRWCAASGKRFSSPERFERCGALAASVARKAVMLLNAQHAGKLSAPSLDRTTAECLGCHGGRGSIANASGRMSCAPCHTPNELAATHAPKA